MAATITVTDAASLRAWVNGLPPLPDRVAEDLSRRLFEQVTG